MTERERAFVAAFLGAARGNATKGAILAGYSAKTARQAASRLLSKVNIQRAIAERIDFMTTAEIADANERDLKLSVFMRDEKIGVRDRIAAIKELNKVTGRHSIRVNVKGKLTLEEALQQSRERDD